MTIRSRIEFFVECDECSGENISVGLDASSPDGAVDVVLEDNWLVERPPFDNDDIAPAGDTHICPDCQSRRVQRTCAARPQGHQWKRGGFGPSPVDDDGWSWISIEDELAVRGCADCPYREYQNAETGIWTTLGEIRPAVHPPVGLS